MGVKIGGHVEKLNAKELNYGEFVKSYVQKNQPVVLSGLMGDWKACTDWVFPDGIPNFRFFSSHFGKSTVQVADCATREFSDQKRIEMSVSEFINHCLEGSAEEPTNGSKSLLYLKDWHFAKEYPKYAAYATPLFFSDDWLNFYLDNYCMHMDPSTYQEKNVISCSDYRFVYMGAKGTWTPLHADVFKSYSWSANVCGRKQWHFLSPSQHHLVFDSVQQLNLSSPKQQQATYNSSSSEILTILCDNLSYDSDDGDSYGDGDGHSYSDLGSLGHLKNSVYDIFEDVSETKFPDFSKAIWLECTQERNEIIFVPSGWYHQVHNLEDTISINHNWFNAHNLSWVWDVLVHDYGEAKEYIEDIKDICDDFEGLCQRNLAANTGMNFNDFFIFIAHMCFANLVQLCYTLRDHRSHNGSLSPVAQHLALNIVYIRQIIVKMKSIKGSSGGRGVSLDLEEILDSPKFLELCDGLGKSYRMIHGELKPLYDTREALLGCIKGLNWTRSYSSFVQSTEDVINIIDSALSELRGTSGGECISHCLDELLKLEEV